MVARRAQRRETLSRRSRTYLALYFNVERAEDLELLTRLYALPVTRRGPAIKHVLRAGLAGYLHSHHPDRSPLGPQAVRDLVAMRARARRRRRRGEQADDDGARVPSPARVSIDPSIPPQGADPAPEALTREADRPSRDAEIRLDRLLRSFLR